MLFKDTIAPVRQLQQSQSNGVVPIDPRIGVYMLEGMYAIAKYAICAKSFAPTNSLYAIRDDVCA